MSFLDLPFEIIQHIISFLDYESELNAILRTNRALYDRLNGLLYQRDAGHEKPRALCWAAAHGSVTATEKALTMSLGDGNQPLDEALAIAAARNSETVVRLLVEHGADPSATGERTDEFRDLPAWCDTYTGNALSIAAKWGAESVVSFLIGYGIRLDDGKPPPVALAASQGHLGVVRLLIDEGCDIETIHHGTSTLLIVAVASAQLDVVRFLLERGARHNIREEPSGATPLAIAARKGWLAGVRCLLEFGAGPNPLVEGDFCPVVWTYTEELPELIRLLMQQPDYVQNTSRDRTMLLCVAALCGLKDLTLELVLNGGCDPNKPPDEAFGSELDLQQTPLQWAMESDRPDIVKILLSHGANPDGRQYHNRDDFMIPLITAARRGNVEITRLLLEYGANPNQSGGWWPALFQTLGHSNDKFELLLEHGASPAFVLEGEGCLGLEVLSEGTVEQVRMMLDQGIDLDLLDRLESLGCGGEDAWSRNVWACAAQGGLDIVQLLQQYGYVPRPVGGRGEEGILLAAAGWGPDLLQIFIDRGFDIHTYSFSSPLLGVAAAIKDSDRGAATVDLLLHHGLDMDEQHGYGCTPLIWSVDRFDNGHATRVLLERGANPLFMGSNGECVLGHLRKSTHISGKYRQVLDAIEARKPSFEEIEPHLVRAPGRTPDTRDYDEPFLRAVRRLYWRTRYPI